MENVYRKGFDWLDVKVIFSRNIPTNVLEQSQVVANLNGVVSRKTLLSVLPFIEDPSAEIELLEKEDMKQVDQFGFGSKPVEPVSQKEVQEGAGVV
jgi:SPP1 family phage portal protein